MKPHVYDHVPPLHRPVLDLLVQPLTIDEIADRLGTTRRVIEYRTNAVCGSMGLERDKGGPQYAWRVSLTRLYYGIDPCWCAKEDAA